MDVTNPKPEFSASPPGDAGGAGSLASVTGGRPEPDITPLAASIRGSRSLGEALNVDAHLIEALYSRAFNFLKTGYCERAKGLFFALCALDGGRADNWLGYGICLRSQGDGHLALAAFDFASKLAPNSAAPHLHRLEALMHLNELDGAHEALRQFDEMVVQAEVDSTLVAAAQPFRVALEMRDG